MPNTVRGDGMRRASFASRGGRHMGSTRRASLALGLAAAFWACGGGESDQQTQQGRDLSLAPAESTARLSDQPAAQPPAGQPTATQPKPPAAKPAAPATLATGT